MNPIIEISLTSKCSMKCDYCIASTEEMITGTNKETGEVTAGWIHPPLPSQAITRDSKGDYEVTYIPIRCNIPDTDEACIARNKANKLPPVKGTPQGTFALNLLKVQNYIKKHLKGFDIVISGGEPLILPGINEFLNEVTKTNKVKLLSNIRQIKQYKSILLNPNIQIKVGYHPEFRKQEEFESNISFMMEHTDNFFVNFVQHPRMMKNDEYNFKRYRKVLDDLGCKYDITMFKGEWEGKKWGTLWETKENTGKEIGVSQKYIKPHALEPTTKDNFMWKPGKTFLTMYVTGDVFECHNQVKKMGNLYDDTLKFEDYTEFLGCINCKTCRCDSMNSYRFMNQTLK